MSKNKRESHIKNNFLINFSHVRGLDCFTTEERGELFTELCAWALDNRDTSKAATTDAPKFKNPGLGFAFGQMAFGILEAWEKYDERCKTNKDIADNRRKNEQNKRGDK